MRIQLFGRRMCGGLAITLLLLCAGNARSQSQSEILDSLFAGYNDSTKELVVNASSKVRGHEIGNGQFKTCRGEVVQIRNRPLVPSDKCTEPPRPTNIAPRTVWVMDWDATKSILKLRFENDPKTYKLFVPNSIGQFSDGEFKGIDRGRFEWTGQAHRITIFQIIPERIEAISLETISSPWLPKH